MSEIAEPTNPVIATEWRGPVAECIHRGAIAIASTSGVEQAFGDIDRAVLPRSACKMIQALALVESGAADRAGLDARHLALACGSHGGTRTHTDLVSDWLTGLELEPEALLCGCHPPLDPETRKEMRKSGLAPNNLHHQCSGKHTGFLTLARESGGIEGYTDPHHPIQLAIRQTLEEVCEEAISRTATDGCSAPNHAVSLRGFARALAKFATSARAFSGKRGAAANRLVSAMIAHPVLVGGPDQVSTRLTQAVNGLSAVKSGAAGVYAAILPQSGLGIAVKIDDGHQATSDAVIAALLARCNVIDPAHPTVRALTQQPILTSRGAECGTLRAADLLMAPAAHAPA